MSDFRNNPFANISEKIKADENNKKKREEKDQSSALPSLPEIDLMSPEQAKELDFGIVKLADEVRRRAQIIGQALAESESRDVRMDAIRHAQDGIVATIDQIENTAGRRTVAEAYMAGLVETVPHDFVGVNHLADQGLACGFLHETKQNQAGIRLPVTVGYYPNGRPNHAGQELVGSDPTISAAIRQMADEVDRARKARIIEAKINLFAEAEDLLTVLERGEGEAAFHAPGDKVRNYSACDLRVRMRDGKLFPLSATGKPASFVEAAKKVGLGIQVSSLTAERLKLDKRLDQTEKRAMFAFWGMCKRGYEAALRQKERRDAYEAMKVKQTVAPPDFVLRNAPGISFLYMKEEWRVGNVTFKNVHFLAERCSQDGSMRVLAFPEHLGKLFLGCGDWMSPGQKFAGLPENFKCLMRAIYSNLRRFEERAVEASSQPQDVADDISFQEGLEMGIGGQSPADK